MRPTWRRLLRLGWLYLRWHWRMALHRLRYYRDRLWRWFRR